MFICDSVRIVFAYSRSYGFVLFSVLSRSEFGWLVFSFNAGIEMTRGVLCRGRLLLPLILLLGTIFQRLVLWSTFCFR